MVESSRNPTDSSTEPPIRKPFQRPNFVISEPETPELTIEPRTIGRLSRPAIVGE